MHFLDQLSVNEMARMSKVAENVGVPSHDPLYGTSGKLMSIWEA